MIHLQNAGLARVLYPLGLCVLGVAMLVNATIAWLDDAVTYAHVAEVPLGAVATALAAYLWFRPRPPAPNLVVVEPPGIRWSDRDTSWAVAWPELVAVSIAVSRSPLGYSRSLQPFAISRWVRVDLYPGDPGFHERHPDLAPFWEASGGKECYRIALGQAEDSMAGLNNGMRMYAQGRYRGITDGGWSFNPFRDQ